jgi:hypothetical protein
VFNVAKQNLVCPYCSNEQEIERATTGAVQARAYRAAVAALRSGAGGEGPQLQGEHEVVCQNCGGHTTFSGTLTSTKCPYCTTPIQRDDVHDAPNRLAVDGVLPFKVDERSANEAVQAWINKRWFAPKEFKKYGKAGAFNSVYMAYFSYDAETTTQYRGERGDNYEVTVGSGDNKRTETRTRWRNVSGQVDNEFEDILVHANEGLNRRHVDKLEPWPLGQVQPFSPEYVAGHLCRTYDHDVEHCFGDAEQTIDKKVERTIKRDIGGDKQRIHAKDTHYRLLDYKHLLLPLWLLTVKFEGAAHQVMVNGVTGEVHGSRPWSKVKLAIAILLALLAVIVVLLILAATGGDDGGATSGGTGTGTGGFGTGSGSGRGG